MSTHKHFDKICCVVLIFCIMLSYVTMHAQDFGITKAEQTNTYAQKFFGEISVNTIDVIVDPDEWENILNNASDKEYIVCKLVINDEIFSNVAIRTKGNSSLQQVQSSDSDRYSFKIEFDHYDNTQSFYGLDKMTLNNIIQDNTYMKDFLMYTLMGEFSVASPLVNYTELFVNGEAVGLYLAVEAIEESFLQRNYGNNYGIAYKPESTGGMGGGMGQIPTEQKQGNMGEIPTEQAQGNMGQIPTEQTQGNMGQIPTEQTQGNMGQIPTEQSQGNMGQIPTEQTQGNMGQMPTEQTQGNMGQMPTEQTQGNMGEMPTEQTQGNMGQMPTEQTQGNMGQIPTEQTQGNMGQMPTEQTQGNMGEIPTEQAQGNMGQIPTEQTQGNMGQMTERPNAMQQGGMGNSSGSTLSEALEYIDDEIENYAYIFDNAAINISQSDKVRLISSLKQLNEQENLDKVLDIEAVIRYFVVHNFALNFDSYTGSIMHNYYLYEKNGAMSMLPWDYNLSFVAFMTSYTTEQMINYPIDTPISTSSIEERPMLSWIFDNEEYTELYHEIFAEFIAEMFDTNHVIELISQVETIISPYVEADTTKFCTYEQFTTGVEALKGFVNLRAESISKQLSGEIPSTAEGQALDSSNLVQTSDVDVTDTGTTQVGGNSTGGGQDRNQGQQNQMQGEQSQMQGQQSQMQGEQSQMQGEQSQMQGEQSQMQGQNDRTQMQAGQMSNRNQVTTEQNDSYAIIGVSIFAMLVSLCVIGFYQKRKF